MKTQTGPGTHGIISSLLPFDSDALTHVPRGWSVSDHQLDSGGRIRTYLLIRPRPDSTPGTGAVTTGTGTGTTGTVTTGTTGTLPVVMVLHGRRENPAAIERITRLIPIVGRAVFVYPSGYGRSWNAGDCCGIAHAAGINDVAFLEAVLHQVLSTQHDASAHHVYLMGFSNGGRMAYRMACQDPGAFAGVAAVEAVPVYDCDRLSPVPLAIIAQSGDPLLTVPRHGDPKTMDGVVEATVGATVAEWRALDGCGAPPEIRHVGVATITRYPDCPTARRLEYDLYRGGRHAWPEGNAATPSAGELIWSFFHDDRLPPLPTTIAHRSPTPASGRSASGRSAS